MRNSADEINVRTRVARVCDTLDDNAKFFSLGFSLAVSNHKPALERCADGFAVLAASPRNGETTTRFVDHVAPGEIRTLSVGRHDHADLIIEGDPSLSLRHAIVILSRDAKGAPFVRVIDLRSIFGVKSPDDTRHLSLASNGSVALRLADTALFILPMATLSPEEQSSLSTTTFDKLVWPQASPFVPTVEPEIQLERLSRFTSETTSISMITSSSEERMKRSPDGEAGRLTLTTDSDSYRFAVDPQLLRAGLLVGRYDRCDINADNIRMPEKVSRVHALLISLDARAYIIDTGSSNGIVLDDAFHKELRLSEERSVTLELGEEMTLKWTPAGEE